jgi:hypothetical protein
MFVTAGVLLCCAAAPIASLLYVQMEHDTRGFTSIYNPEEEAAEEARRMRAAEGVPRPQE